MTNNLRDSVKNWLQIDNEIKQLQKEIKKEELLKNKLPTSLLTL